LSPILGIENARNNLNLVTMRRLFVPTFGPSDWRRLLADPARHWRQRKSAYELAVAWEAARETLRGIPSDVAALLDTVPELAQAELLIGVPEHQFDLDGGGHASQTDLWALLTTPECLVSAAIEAKAGEKFDKLVPEWLDAGSSRTGKPSRPSGKPARLQQLCRVLGITEEQARKCRYQLLHRAAVALLEARRFQLRRAVFLVQSFTPDQDSFDDFQCFTQQLGAKATENRIVASGLRDGVELWIGWLSSQPADDKTVRGAV
jgi:hypothetical protein